MRPTNLENKISDTYWRVPLVCMKVQAHCSLEPPLEYNTGTFGRPRLVRTLTNLGVTEILSSFILVLEGRKSKEISDSSRLEFLEKSSANNFTLSDAEDSTSGPLTRGGIAFIENNISSLPKVPRDKFLGSGRLFCFVSICKFSSFKNLFVTITSLSELYFRFRRFILLVQTKIDFYELWQ